MEYVEWVKTENNERYQVIVQGLKIWKNKCNFRNCSWLPPSAIMPSALHLSPYAFVPPAF